MIHSLVSNAGHVVYNVTLGTFQKLYNERELTPAYGYAKMILQSALSASIVGLGARTFSYPAKIPSLISALVVFAYLAKDYTDPKDGQWSEDRQKQNEWLDSYPILEKFLERY